LRLSIWLDSGNGHWGFSLLSYFQNNNKKTEKKKKKKKKKREKAMAIVGNHL
jgi:hypothetical protein